MRTRSSPRDRLIEGLWGEAAPPASAAGSLQVNVHALRKAIGPERIVTRSPGYVIRVEPDELDVLRFERLVTEGRQALQGGDAAGASASLADALALWRGPALADYRYASFARTEAQRLEEAAAGRARSANRGRSPARPAYAISSPSSRRWSPSTRCASGYAVS